MHRILSLIFDRRDFGKWDHNSDPDLKERAMRKREEGEGERERKGGRERGEKMGGKEREKERRGREEGEGRKLKLGYLSVCAHNSVPSVCVLSESPGLSGMNLCCHFFHV